MAIEDLVYSKRSEIRDAFDSDELLQVWVLYHLQILGEAAQRAARRVGGPVPTGGLPSRLLRR